jgi:hypothetical protein
LPGGTEEDHEKSQHSQSQFLIYSLGSPEYKAGLLATQLQHAVLDTKFTGHMTVLIILHITK